ncbi:MAG: V-type ATP synthase subunit F [Erysipelotrichaceae bacterium]
MKIFLISDNTDTAMGLRLAGIESVVVHKREEMLEKLEELISANEIGVILLTTKAIHLAPKEIADFKLNLSKPLICEIPDRHGSAKIGEQINQYISDAIGIKI